MQMAIGEGSPARIKRDGASSWKRRRRRHRM